MDPDADAVSYDEFLALARDEGLIALDVQVIQAPADANGRSAVVQATARTAQGSFGAVGEASPHSAPAAWHPFLTTLAELRAKARALRDLTGLEHAVLEELSTPYQQSERAGDTDAPVWRQSPANGAAPRPAVTAPRRGAAPARSAAPAFDEDGDEDEDEEAPDDEAAAPQAVTPAHAAVSASTAPARPAASAAQPAANSTPARPSTSAVRSPDAEAEPEEEPDAGFDAMSKEMEAKLIKMALSIASLEGSDISEAEARQKLDDFFLRAFKHPLNRATRLEGQRVVQRLSGDLARLRAAANEEKE